MNYFRSSLPHEYRKRSELRLGFRIPISGKPCCLRLKVVPHPLEKRRLTIGGNTQEKIQMRILYLGAQASVNLDKLRVLQRTLKTQQTTLSGRERGTFWHMIPSSCQGQYFLQSFLSPASPRRGQGLQLRWQPSDECIQHSSVGSLWFVTIEL